MRDNCGGGTLLQPLLHVASGSLFYLPLFRQILPFYCFGHYERPLSRRPKREHEAGPY